MICISWGFPSPFDNTVAKLQAASNWVSEGDVNHLPVGTGP